jgi:pyridoxamine 5'-phosphate oxidase family protein
MTTTTTPLTAKESAYLAAHQLGRLATIGPDGSPHVVPVSYRFNPDATIDIGGPNLGTSQNYRNAQREPRVAFVVDDTTPDDEPIFRPKVGRGIHIRGRAEALADHDPPGLASPGLFSREIIRIHPESRSSAGTSTLPGRGCGSSQTVADGCRQPPTPTAIGI